MAASDAHPFDSVSVVTGVVVGAVTLIIGYLVLKAESVSPAAGAGIFTGTTTGNENGTEAGDVAAGTSQGTAAGTKAGAAIAAGDQGGRV